MYTQAHNVRNTLYIDNSPDTTISSVYLWLHVLSFLPIVLCQLCNSLHSNSFSLHFNMLVGSVTAFLPSSISERILKRVTKYSNKFQVKMLYMVVAFITRLNYFLDFLRCYSLLNIRNPLQRKNREASLYTFFWNVFFPLLFEHFPISYGFSRCFQHSLIHTLSIASKAYPLFY